MQILEAERARLSLLEEKIKEVLVMLRALNSTVSNNNHMSDMFPIAIIILVNTYTLHLLVLKFSILYFF